MGLRGDTTGATTIAREHARHSEVFMTDVINTLKYAEYDPTGPHIRAGKVCHLRHRVQVLSRGAVHKVSDGLRVEWICTRSDGNRVRLRVPIRPHVQYPHGEFLCDYVVNVPKSKYSR